VFVITVVIEVYSSDFADRTVTLLWLNNTTCSKSV